jgi:DNA-binding MarR family transcriptional regulator
MGSHTIPRLARQADIRGPLDDIRRLVQFLRVASRATEQKLGISGAQVFVLHELARGPVESLSELAQRTFTHQSSVSVVVTRLAERKLVLRTTDPKDARRVRIAIGPKGRDLLQRAPEVAQIRLIAALLRLPSGTRRALQEGLSALVAELGFEGQAVPLFFEEDAAPAGPSVRGRGRGLHASVKARGPKRSAQSTEVSGGDR